MLELNGVDIAHKVPDVTVAVVRSLTEDEQREMIAEDIKATKSTVTKWREAVASILADEDAAIAFATEPFRTVPVPTHDKAVTVSGRKTGGRVVKFSVESRSLLRALDIGGTIVPLSKNASGTPIVRTEAGTLAIRWTTKRADDGWCDVDVTVRAAMGDELASDGSGRPKAERVRI